MTDAPATVRERAERLREEFDAAFQVEPSLEERLNEVLLAVSVGGRAHAVRLAEITAVSPWRRVRKLPSPFAELLGVSGFRGSVVPVYDLAQLLGLTASEADQGALLLCGTARPIALSVGGSPEYFRVPGTSIAEDPRADTNRPLRGVVALRGVLHPIVDIPAIFSSIEARVRSHAGPAPGASKP